MLTRLASAQIKEKEKESKELKQDRLIGREGESNSQDSLNSQIVYLIS